MIATAVMDNGVSFHDTALRNMVIFADTKEEFIQMLGRKRTDGKLLICMCVEGTESILENALLLQKRY